VDVGEAVGEHSNDVWSVPQGAHAYGDLTDGDDLGLNIVVSLAKAGSAAPSGTGPIHTPRPVPQAASCKSEAAAGAAPVVRVGAPGDNGGPLCVQAANGYRNVIGVASILGDPADVGVRPQALPALAACAPFPSSTGSATSCTGWVDVTSPTAKTWISLRAR